eukprot:COSAG05_NODE_1806_length_4045_cov_2.386721_2_plen_61_part_00
MCILWQTKHVLKQLPQYARPQMVNPMFALQGDAALDMEYDVENSAGGFNPLAEPTEKVRP